jgi:hypothetical protein
MADPRASPTLQSSVEDSFSQLTPDKMEGQMAQAETIFNTPMGSDQVNPSPESLRDLVLRGGDDFWAAGSGQAALEVKGDGGARLLLMGLDAAGFFLVHESKNDSFCSRNPSVAADGHQIVEIHVGGEPMQVPLQNFLDKELAWKVIAGFLRDAKRSPQIEWEVWL